MAEQELSGAVIGEVAGRVAGSVVRIGRDWGRGAGFVLAAGRVATNAHNLRGREVTVAFADGRVETGRVLGVDADTDLAVVDVPTARLAPLAWSDTDPGLGAPVLTLTLDAVAGTRATSGRVSALGAAFRGPQGRLVRGAIEHTAPLARGSSGSPLLDVAGRLLGLNTHRRDDGFYLAQRADAALRARLDELAAGAATPGVRLGVAVAPPEVARRLRSAVGLPERDGLLVAGVVAGGPAEAAGVRRGDLLVALDGRPLRTSDDLFDALDGLRPGAEVPLLLARGIEEVTVTVRFGGDAPA